VSGDALRRWTTIFRAYRVVAVLVPVVMMLRHFPDLSRALPTAAGVSVGLEVACWLAAGYLAGPARRLGLRVDSWTFGVGAPLRTSIGPRGVWQLRRIPLPVVRPLSRGTLTTLTEKQLASALLLVLAADALCAALLALAGGEFGRAAAVTCLLSGVGPVLVVAVSGATRPAGVRVPGDQELTAALQRDIPEARRLLDALPPGPATRALGLPVLLAEGRYRELADTVAELQGERPDPGQQLLHARALAYLDETGAATDADRETFRALHRTLRRASRAYRQGSDLNALHELAEGHPGLAIDEARAAASIGSAPIRRTMAYATLALAFHRAGRPAEARTALESARTCGPATARLEFLTDLLAQPAAVE